MCQTQHKDAEHMAQLLCSETLFRCGPAARRASSVPHSGLSQPLAFANDTADNGRLTYSSSQILYFKTPWGQLTSWMASRLASDSRSWP